MSTEDSSGNESNGVECPTCEKSFTTTQGMKTHHASVHGESIAGVEVICEYCESTYRAKRPERTKYCSVTCRNKGSVKNVETECEYCGEAFDVKPHKKDSRRYCSQDCKNRHQTGENHPMWNSHTYDCDNCGDEILVHQSSLNRHESHFCDSGCMYEYQTGDNHPNWNSVSATCLNCGVEFTRHKARIGGRSFCTHSCYSEWLPENISGPDHPLWKRQQVSCEVCGEDIWRKQHQLDGRTHYCSYSCLHSIGTGSFIHAIRDGLSSGKWWKIAREWRSASDRQCELCGVPESAEGRALSAHHIVPVGAGGCNEDELLMPLCDQCHPTVEQYTASIPEVTSLSEYADV